MVKKQRRAVRSDGTTLHVDFENFTDSLITARNAGVVVAHQTRAKILDTYGFTGRRCAHIATSWLWPCIGVAARVTTCPTAGAPFLKC